MQRKGIDYIGLAHCFKPVIKYHPKGLGIGLLQKASGWRNGLRGLRKVLKERSSDIPFVRVHALWYDNHTFTKSDIKKAVKQAKKLAKIVDQFPEVDFYFSPWLESYASAPLTRKCLEKCREVLPTRVLLVSTGAFVSGYINEVHHSKPVNGHYSFSYDGESMRDANISQYKREHSQALLFMGWTWKCNGKKDKYDKTSRFARRFKDNWVNEQEIKYIASNL